jgi:hypothetical protein
MRFLLALMALAVLALPAQAETVFNALPSVRVRSDATQTSREELSELEQERSRITIVRRDGRYLWTTRDAFELVLRGSLEGPTFLFVEPNGAGYVVILDTHALPDSLRASGPRYWFMEHVRDVLGTITYWGACNDLCFRPWVGE